MVDNNIGIAFTLRSYLGCVLGIGNITYKHTTNLSQYLLGERSLGPVT